MQTEITDVSDLVSKTVFLKTRFGLVGNSRKVSGSDVLETDADKGLLKVSKTLLDSVELDAIKKADAKMRAWLYNTCLPYDLGIQILPNGLIEATETRLQAYKAERLQLVEAFIVAYPALRESASAHLGSLYDMGDYPSVDILRTKFVFDWEYKSFSVPGQLKAISASFFEAEQEKAAKQMQTVTDEITALMRQSLFDMVSHLKDRLTPGDDGKPRILKESAVQNVKDFLATFDLRNVTDDKELAAQVAKVRGILDGVDTKTLRSSDSFRETIRANMAAVTETLGGMIETKAGRMFKDEDEEPASIAPVPDYKMLAANDVVAAA